MSDTIKETPEVRSEAEAVSENIPPELRDALSPITAIRQSWFDNLPLPRFELGTGVKKMERLNKSGTSGYGNVYKVEVNGKPVAVKFIKSRSGSVRGGRGGANNVIKEGYAGLTLTHAIRPDVFAEAYGVVYSTAGNPVGVAMEYIPDCVELGEFWEDNPSDPLITGVFNPHHQPGKVLEKSFFSTLRSAINAAISAGLVFPDFNRPNVLVDGNMQPRIVDVDYIVDPEIIRTALFNPIQYILIAAYYKSAVTETIDLWESEFEKE